MWLEIKKLNFYNSFSLFCSVTDIDDLYSNVTVTASKGVFIKNFEQQGWPNDQEEILAAVFGLNMQYTSLYAMFNYTTSFCSESMNCNDTDCTSPVSNVLGSLYLQQSSLYIK